jgi:hypothetical protein
MLMVAGPSIIKFSFMAMSTSRLFFLVALVPTCVTKEVNMALYFIYVIANSFILELEGDWKVIPLFSFMGPQPSHEKVIPLRKTHNGIVVEEEVARYKESISPSARATMHLVKEEVKIIMAYHEDVDIDQHVGDLVPNLGTSQNQDMQFHRTMEFCWYTKTLVAQLMLPKEKDYRYFGQRLEYLERHNRLFLTLVSYLVKKNGGAI